MGFVGMVIGVPTFAVIYDLIKKYSNWMLRKKRLATDTSVYEGLSLVKPEGEEYRYIHKGEEEVEKNDSGN